MRIRTCSQCHIPKEATTEHFIPRADRPWLFLAICRTCRAARRKQHRFNRPDLYQRELHIRSAVRRRVCASCSQKGELHWYGIQGKAALYHSPCAKERMDELGIISPERKKELLRIAEGVV